MSDIEKSKYQKFKIETINRQDIQNAEYNPRIIDESARKKLKSALRKHGLVSAITYNKRTGNIVGGHQRIEQLDSLERNKNYNLDVCVVDVDEKEEAVLNVQLNNPSMQGDWDLDKLKDMSFDFDATFEEMGFSKIDTLFMFDGDRDIEELFEPEEVKETKHSLEDIKKARQEGQENLKDRGNINFYSTLLFEDEEEKREFYKKINRSIWEDFLTIDDLMRLVDKG